MENRVDILLAAYNGARFLAEQIESLFAQTHHPFRLLVRDDGSSDGTPALLAEHAAQRPDAIVLVDPAGPHLGASGSFARLLEYSDAPYVMFCDQDDVWLPGKIALLLDHMRAFEAQLPSQTPILVHSDLTVVDESLHVRQRSFWRSQRLDPCGGVALNRLLVENVVAGCAAMLNRPLARQCVPIPPSAVMHDWWIALVAAALGRIEHIPEATMLYRQHAANRVGAKRGGAVRMAGRALAFFGPQGYRGHLRQTQRQAQTLLERWGPSLRPADRATVEIYATLDNYGPLRRRWLLWRYGFRTASWLGNAKLYAGI
jgi:glycosyltransferase involved in cell wall biosynthesis